MTRNNNQTILVVNDVAATRESIRELLTRDGYEVKTARDELEAADASLIKPFDLLLISLDGEIVEIIEIIKRIRKSAALGENVPAIIFCADGFGEYETAVEPNIFLSCPENFNRLREFISRLLRRFQKAAV